MGNKRSTRERKTRDKSKANGKFATKAKNNLSSVLLLFYAFIQGSRLYKKKAGGGRNNCYLNICTYCKFKRESIPKLLISILFEP